MRARPYKSKAERLAHRRAQYKTKLAHLRPKLIHIGLDVMAQARKPKEQVFHYALNGHEHAILAPSAIVARQLLAERLGVRQDQLVPAGHMTLPADRKNPWGTAKEQAQAALARIRARAQGYEANQTAIAPPTAKPDPKDVNFDFNSED